MVKKDKNFFPYRYDNLCTNRNRNMLFPNFFRVKSGHKNPKNSVKINLFKGRFKKSCDM
jgi:hypothetical protein